MLDSLYLRLADRSAAALIIIPLAIMFFCAFGMTRITKRLRLPSVTAYLTAGILIGPCCLNLIPQPMIEKTDFLADLALCFIAFSAGEFFKLETLRKNGWKVVWVTIAEACAASLVVFGVTRFLLGLNLPFCVVLAALASATAPASTMMTIRQTGAQGELVDTLLQVVALDDVVSLLAYSAAIAFALHSLTGRSSDPVGDLLVPIGTTLGMLVLGSVCGLLLKWLLPATRTTDNRLILALGVLFAFCGLCDMLEVSPLLGCMSMGMVYINLTGDDLLFAQLASFSPPILLLFFVRSGLCFDLGALFSASPDGSESLLTIGILYFFARIIGKYAGAWLGCRTAGLSQPVCRKGRCAAAKIQAVRFLFTALLTAHSVDLPQQSIYVSVAQILGISDLAVRTEVADAPAKRDMHIQAQIVAVLVRQNIVVFIFEDERLCRTCQPHSGQRCNDTHMAPICISGRLSASQV